MFRIFLDGESAKLSAVFFRPNQLTSEETTHIPTGRHENDVFEPFRLDVVGDPSLVYDDACQLCIRRQSTRVEATNHRNQSS